jgi:uncharacterized protein (DUF2147 family)
MRATLIMAAVLLAMVATPVLAEDGDAVVGLWATAPDTEDGQAHVDIYKKDGLYYGKIVWLEIPRYPEDDDGGMAGKAKVDRENPDESLRDRPIQGLPIMFDFVYKGKNKYAKGTIYAPDDGKTYKCKLTLEDKDNLKVRGYIGVAMLGRTEKWTRVNEK